MRLSAGEREDIRNRIDMARRHAEDVWVPKVDAARALFSGDHWEGMGGFEDGRITVNYLFAHTEIKLAAISFQYPDFVIRTMRAEDKPREEGSRAALQFVWQQIAAQTDAARALQDRMVCGLGACTTTWELVTEEEDGKTGSTYLGRRPDVAGDPADTTENPEYPVPAPLPKARIDEPRVSWIDPRSVFVAPESPRVFDRRLPYVGYTERVTVSALKARKGYRIPKDYTGSASDMRPLFGPTLSLTKDADLPGDVKRATLSHYFEWDRKLHAVYADGINEPVFTETWPWPFDRYPIRFLMAHGPTESFWPKAPLLELAHAQKEINQARSLLAHHQRQSSRKLQVQGALSPKAIRQLEAAGQLAVVNTQPGQRIETIPHAPLQPEAFQSLGQAMEDLQFLGGLSAYEAYQEPSKRLTTSEVQQIARSGQARAERLRDDYEKFLSHLGQDVLAWMQQYSAATKKMPIRDRSGKVLDWGDYTKEDLAGEFLVEVYVGSTQPPTRDRQLQDFGFFLQTLTNAIQATIAGGQVSINLRPLLKQLFAAVPEIRDVDEIVPDQTPGMPGPGAALGPGGPMSPAGPEGGPDSPAGSPLAPNGSIPPNFLQILQQLGDEDLGHLSQLE